MIEHEVASTMARYAEILSLCAARYLLTSPKIERVLASVPLYY
jgi:hypothetical protein